MDLQHAIDTLLAACLAAVGWIVRTLHGDVKSLSDELTSHKVEVAKTYATNADITRIEDKLDRILDKLERKADK